MYHTTSEKELELEADTDIKVDQWGEIGLY